MKLIIARIFVVVALTALVIAISPIGLDEPPAWLSSNVGFVAFIVLLVVAVFLFSGSGRRHPRFPSDSVEDLEEKGLLLQEDYQARRAFQIEEFEDEGSHYMIELHNGSVLYLNGQYLYDCEPIENDPEFNQPRKFPCTEFTVLRNKVTGDAIEILCRGDVLEPECLAPGFDMIEYKRGLAPEDGQIITDKTYEELKQERLSKKAGK